MLRAAGRRTGRNCGRSGTRENRGKGAAVRTGMLAARGELLLFADADGATPIEEQGRLAGGDRGRGRRGGRLAAVARRGPRGAESGSAAWPAGSSPPLARRLLRLPVRDTQCGFKMFRGEVGPAAVRHRPGSRDTCSTWNCWPRPAARATGSSRCRSVGTRFRGGHLHPLSRVAADRRRAVAAAATAAADWRSHTDAVAANRGLHACDGVTVPQSTV